MLATLDPSETANAVDVGCGSGILAIAMAKLWQRPVIGGDNDAEAVDVARENAELNGVANFCRFFVSAGLDTDELVDASAYDLIVANILRRAAGRAFQSPSPPRSGQGDVYC